MEEDYSGKEEMTYPLAYLAKTDEDVMYYHQAMQQLKKIRQGHCKRNERPMQQDAQKAYPQGRRP